MKVCVYFVLSITFYLLCLCYNLVKADNPCAALAIPGQSVVCVCNATYCDDVIREAPDPGGYVSYTSSKSGLRFSKVRGVLEDFNPSVKCCSHTLVIDPDVKFQTIEGFGGAVTDSAGLNWKNLTQALQDALISAYFSDNGLQYNMLRVPIGGSDFSTRPYAYNELPEDDTQLSNFTLAFEDTEYKLPMIRQIMQTASAPVHIVATTWAPPRWMKTNHNFTGRGILRKKHFQTYADYHLKFVEMYSNEGVPIWAITTTNEPLNGLLPIIADKINCLGWTPHQMGRWIVNNLGPTIRNSTFKDLKILTMDDQRYAIPVWLDVMIKKHPQVLDYIDGVGVHFYADFAVVPASLLSGIPKKYPGKFVLATEGCEGSYPLQKKVILGSWHRAQSYTTDIIEDLNHEVVGWLDWNLCLNVHGGPNWVANNVDSPIIVFPENNEFVKNPMFYAMGHFSKFVPRGSRRIRVMEKKGVFEKSVRNVAFVTPYGTVVVVLYNGCCEKKIALKLGSQQARLSLEADSITTIEMPYNTDLKVSDNETI